LPRHGGAAVVLLKQFRLTGVDPLHLLLGGITLKVSLKNGVDGRFSDPSLLKIKFIRKVLQIEFIHCLSPRNIMCRHGIIQHTIHIENNRFQLEFTVLMLLQIRF